MIAVGANLDLIDNSKYTALKIAFERGYTEIAELLIEAGATVDQYD
jgi:ankyrin repeat protein